MISEKYSDDYIIDSLCEGVEDELKIELKNLLLKTCKDYSHLFESDFFKQKIQNTEVYLLLLPAVRRAWSGFFIKTPQIFHNSERLDTFQKLFSLDDFMSDFTSKLKKNKNCLDDFENLDIMAELMTIIISNYIAGKIELTKEIHSDSQKIKQFKRNWKLENNLKI